MAHYETTGNDNTPISEDVKKKTLELYGWYHWYSETHWVHKDIKQMLERRGKIFYCPDHTGWQLSTDEAFEYLRKYQDK